MKYYKLLNDGNFIGVGTSYDLRKFQSKHNILLTSDDNSAQYIQINDELFRDEWLTPVATDQLPYTTVKIIVIDKDEYDALYDAVETGKEIDIIEEEQNTYEEIPSVDSDELVTKEYIKMAKTAEMSAACRKAITNGFDVTLSDEQIHHFSLTVQDQLNLLTLSSAVSSGETEIPYHADGESCRYYSAEDITIIINEANYHKNYHTTYFNSLKAYIDSLNSITKISSITYGVEIPKKYRSEVLRDFLEYNIQD